jgi:hypothetical protein
MSSTIQEVLQQLRAVIGELDQAAVTASAAQEDARRAYSFFDEAATGSAHPQMNIARQEANIAAAKAGKVARLLAEAATAFADYVNQVAPGAVPSRASAPEALPSGEQLSEPSARGPLMKRLAGKLAATPNADDGLEGISTIGNNVQDAARPGGVVVPQSPTAVYRSTETDSAHVGDALVAAFTLALVGIKAAEAAARLYSKARPHDRKESEKDDGDGR